MGEKPTDTSSDTPLDTSVDTSASGESDVSDAMQSTVVIADDELAHRKMIELALRSGDYQVRAFENGQDVLDYLAAHYKPSLFVLDINMPFLDGLELCTKIRQNPDLANIPVIIVTALKDDKTKREAKEAAADLVFEKPIDRREFLTAVSMLLRQAEKLEP